MVNIFVDSFWQKKPGKFELLASVVNKPESHLTHRARKEAARQAIDLITISKKLKSGKPVFSGKSVRLTSSIVKFQKSRGSSFDVWLRFSSLGNAIMFSLPIKLHRHFNKLQAKGKLLNSFVISKSYVQFCFEIETGEKKKTGGSIGLDSGIKSLASLSNRKQYGQDIEQKITRINRCKHGSKGQQQARRACKQYIDETANQIFKDNDIKLIVVEQLKNLSQKTKLKRRLSKNMRRVIGSWTYRYWLTRVQNASEIGRSTFRSVPSYYTSQECPACGFSDKKNRLTQEMFKCQKCGHTDNADINAAKNILARFISGPYGAGFKDN